MANLSRRLRAVLTSAAVVAATATFVGVGQQAASADTPLCTNVDGYFWSTETDMANASGGYCRSSFVFDPSQGKFVTRDQLLEHTDLYGALGYSTQFLWYAPKTTVTIPANSPQRWSACESVESRVYNPCRISDLNLNDGHTISSDFDFNTVTLTSLAYDGNWIALVCGNTNIRGNNDLVPAPVPTIQGIKFDDSNRDGVQDNGESGVGGITFDLIRDSSLYGQPSEVVATTASGSDGSFSFRLDGDAPGTYTVQERPQSGWVSTTAMSRTLTVDPGIGDKVFDVAFGNRVENPPVAVLPPDQSFDQSDPHGTAVTLDGSASYDPDGDPLSYAWTGPFGTATGVSPEVEMPPGTWPVTLTVWDGHLYSNTATMHITVYPPITLTGHDIAPTEGRSFSGTVGTFTDPDPDGPVDEYAATVDWGDGASSAGTITKGTDGTFTVTAAHTYAEEDTYQATVTVTDLEVPYNTATQGFTATVGDALLHASGRCPLYSTNPIDDTVATFTDDNPGATLADFTATIDWGDGTPTTQGVISGPDDNGVFSVAGQHTYAQLGPETITVTVTDDGGSQSTATTCVLIYQASGFVIGDLNATVGTQVTYWGAQWWKLNGLSGGPAPAAFKGYENAPGASTTLDSWTTDPGNSSNPPAAVPTYMAVIVSSSITQSGSTISGNAPHVVIVQTDPGYAGNPGHPGTGTVVAVLR